MDASELDEAEEVFDVELPSGDEPAEVMHPGEESFDVPALLVTAQFASVLSVASVAAVRGDHLHAVFVLEREEDCCQRDSDDLCALAPARGANGKAPCLALAKVASTTACSRLSLPCS